MGPPGYTGGSAAPSPPILQLGRQQNWKQFPSGLPQPVYSPIPAAAAGGQEP